MSLRDTIHKHLESLVVYKQNVSEAVVALDTLVREHRSEIPGDLAHYLDNRSYGKAWTWVNDGRKAARGTCGGK